MPYYLRVQTEDQVGNQAAWTTLFTLLYDNQPPLISDLTPPNGSVLDTAWPTISATLSDPSTGSGQARSPARGPALSIAEGSSR